MAVVGLASNFAARSGIRSPRALAPRTELTIFAPMPLTELSFFALELLQHSPLFRSQLPSSASRASICRFFNVNLIISILVITIINITTNTIIK
jgi:hypothetical protein